MQNVSPDENHPDSGLQNIERAGGPPEQTGGIYAEREKRYKRLLAAANDYIFTVVVDEGRSVATNHGPGCFAVTGYSSQEFETDHDLWYRIIQEQDRPAVLQQVARVLKGETPPPLEHRLLHKNGGTRWVQNISVPYMDGEGTLVAYDGLISDITPRKQAEEALKKTLAELGASHQQLKSIQLELIQSAKMETLGTLAAGIVHEVKNPLATIVLGLDFLTQKLSPPNPDVQQVFMLMQEAVQRADSLVRELLRLAAPTKLQMKPERIHTVAEQALMLVSYQLSAARIQVIQQMNPSLPQVLMDRMKIEQVFMNLFINALQAMPNGGTLTLRSRSGQWKPDLLRIPNPQCPLSPGEPVVIVEVQDTGMGIPEKHLPLVSEPFFTTKPAGTGLGLSVIKNIIDLHNGALDIRNAPENGVCVTLYLKPEPQSATA